LASNFFLHEKIKTTEARAKEIRPLVEKFITMAKKGDIATIRHLRRFFFPKLVKKLVAEIAPRYKERAGGYTRILKLGLRSLDGAKMAIIELI